MKKVLSAFGILLLALNAGAETHDGDGLTPLHLAAGRGDLTAVKKLLDSGADVNALDSKMGVSVLHKAVYSGNPEVVRALLACGALINLISPSNGDTPLHDAIYFKERQSGAELIRLLLRSGASLSIKNRAGLTPLDSARLLKDAESEQLIQAEERKRYTDSGRALMLAVRARNTKPLTKLLLEKGADPNHLDAWMGANSGHKAAFWGRTSTMKLLVSHGLDINARGAYNGYTPLHDAVSGSHWETAQVLVNAGARKDIRGHDGKTPVDIARSNGDSRMLAILTADQKPAKP